MKKTGGKKQVDVKEAPSKSPQVKWWKKALIVALAMAWLVVALIGAELLVGFLVGKMLPIELLSSPIVNASFSMVSYLLAAFLIIFVPTKIPRIKDLIESSRERLGLRGLPTWTDIGLAPIGYIVTIVIVMGLTTIFNNFDWFNGNEAQNLGYSFYMQGWERGIAFIELAIFAPIIEELLFRGWLYGNLRIRIPKPLAILLVSLLFGLVHMQWNVGITVFAMSVVSCTMREITGSIYAGTLMHMINNTVAFYLVYVIGMA